jgi:hypothetical protein
MSATGKVAAMLLNFGIGRVESASIEFAAFGSRGRNPDSEIIREVFVSGSW